MECHHKVQKPDKAQLLWNTGNRVRKRMALQDDHRDKEPSSQKMSHRKNSAEEWQAKTRMLPHPLFVGQTKSCCIGLLALAVPPLSRILGRFLSWPQTLAGHSLVFPLWMVLKTSPETMRRIVLWYRAHVDPPNCFQSFGSWVLNVVRGQYIPYVGYVGICM